VVEARKPEPATIEPPKAEPPPPPEKVTSVVPAPDTSKAAKIPPPPPKPTGPVTIAPNLVKRTSGELGRIKAVVRDDETLPSTLAAKICIDASGKPTSVKVMSKTAADLAERLAKEMRSFRYTPYKQDGVAVPACFAETFRVK
jgi:hypothetical protein